MTASFSSAGASAGSNAAAGNFSSGQVGMDTARYQLHCHAQIRRQYWADDWRCGREFGARRQHDDARCPRAARVDMLNRFSSTLSMGSQRSAGASQEAGTQMTAGTGRTLSSQSSDAATLSDLRRKGGSHAMVQSIDQAGALSKSGGKQGSAAGTVRQHKDYSDSFSFGSGINASTSLRLGARVGSGSQWGGAYGAAVGGAGGSSNTTGNSLMDPDEKRLLDAMESQARHHRRRLSPCKGCATAGQTHPTQGLGRAKPLAGGPQRDSMLVLM